MKRRGKNRRRVITSTSLSHSRSSKAVRCSKAFQLCVCISTILCKRVRNSNSNSNSNNEDDDDQANSSEFRLFKELKACIF